MLPATQMAEVIGSGGCQGRDVIGDSPFVDGPKPGGASRTSSCTTSYLGRCPVEIPWNNDCIGAWGGDVDRSGVAEAWDESLASQAKRGKLLEGLPLTLRSRPC